MARHHGNRYGRSEAAHDAVLGAARDLLVQVGLATMTMEGLARQAGVSKQTIYRWWPRITDVLVDVVCRDAGQRLDLPDTGTVDGDIDATAHRLADFLVHDDAGQVLLALRAHGQLDRGFGASFEERFLAGQTARERQPFQQAIERGELSADLDVDTARQLLVGPLYDGAASGRLTVDLVAATVEAVGATLDKHRPRPAPSEGAGTRGRS